MTTTTEKPSSDARSASFQDDPPYVIFHIQTPAGRLYQVNGAGFETQDPDLATRHPVSPDIHYFRLDGVAGCHQNIHCSAPLFITTGSPEQTELYWGNRRLLLCPDDLVAQAGRLVWAKVKHFYRGGYPFGPVVRIVIDGPEEKVAPFNIEIHPPRGQLGFLHPAAHDWDSSPRSIQTHLGLLGFSIENRLGPDGVSTIWRRPLEGIVGDLLLETGVGSLVQSLTVEIAGQPPCKVSGIGETGSHNDLHHKLLSLIRSLQFSDGPIILPSLISSLFPHGKPPGTPLP